MIQAECECYPDRNTTTVQVVEIEVDFLRRLPRMVVVGLHGAGWHKIWDLVRAEVLKRGNIESLSRFGRIIVGISPMDLRKNEMDLVGPIATAILVQAGLAPHPDKILTRDHAYTD